MDYLVIFRTVRFRSLQYNSELFSIHYYCDWTISNHSEFNKKITFTLSPAITLCQLEAKYSPLRIRSMRCVSVHYAVTAVCIVYPQHNSFLLWLLLSLLLCTIHDSCSRMSIGHYGIIFLSKHLIQTFVVVVAVVRLFILLHISALWFGIVLSFAFSSLYVYIIYHVPI